MSSVVASCSARTVQVDVPIAAYVPVACGDAGGAPVTYTGLGDFPPSSVVAEATQLGSSGFTLAALSPATRAIVLAPAVAGAGGWAAAATVPDAGPVQMLTLPLDRACPLSKRVNLAGDLGATFGMVDATDALLVGGTVPPFAVDLGNGAITQLPAALALAPPRDYATVTRFGAGALVAGGEDPTRQGEAQQTAVVLTPGEASSAAGAGSRWANGTFGQPIVLAGGQRTRHAAVVLPDGRTLLVGGTGDKALVTALEVLDPADPTRPSVLAASLATGRLRPTVLVLPSGHVFVGGGTDPAGNPVATVEWFAPDLTALGTSTLCSAGVAQGFAPTEGTAVLAVLGPGPATPGCSNVHVLRPPPAGVVDAPALAAPPLVVTLFPGAQASPVLITDVATLRWDPWASAFAPLGAGMSGLSLPTPAFLAPSPGLALWLAEDNDVWTLRFDTHGPYATDVTHGPYLVTDALYTAPDRLVGGDVSFSPATGAVLSNGATVWLTDATFAGVTASVVALSGGDVSLVLRDANGGEVVCAAAGVPALATVQAVRGGATVTMAVAGGPASPCTGAVDPAARVAVGVRGPATGTTSVRSLTVER